MNIAAQMMPGDWKQWEGDLVGGEFPLEQLLGVGEKSAVFRTRIPSGDAAIKLIPARGAQAENLLERWSRASALDHPNLIRIVGTGTWAKGGVPLAYVVTEYAEENLAMVLSERPLTRDETLEMIHAVVKGLAFLHDRGFAHGRLKPSNIFAAKDMLKISSDAVSVGDASSDLRALAATMTDALTQPSVRKQPGGTDLIETLPRPFREIAQNCVGRAGWSATELAGWLESQKGANSATAASGQRSRARTPKLAYSAIALVATVTITAGVLRHRITAPATTAPTSSVQSAPVLPAPAARPQSATSPEIQVTAAPTKPPVHEIQSPRAVGDLQRAVVHEVLPDIPAKARRTVHGTARVFVKVDVDSSGEVTKAALERGGSRYFGPISAGSSPEMALRPRHHVDKGVVFAIRDHSNEDPRCCWEISGALHLVTRSRRRTFMPVLSSACCQARFARVDRVMSSILSPEKQLVAVSFDSTQPAFTILMDS